MNEKGDVETQGAKQFEVYDGSDRSSRDAKLEDVQLRDPAAINHKLRNPLAGFSKEQLLDDVTAFAKEPGKPKAFEEVKDLSEDEKELLRNEWEKRWKQPWMMYFMTNRVNVPMLTLRSWYNPLIARFALGFAVGAKSSTTLVYAAECSPTPIRGALAMQWQMWTAFGIMLGFIVSVAFQDVSTATIPFLNWRLMLGSTGIPPLVVTVQVYFCPESPRWYMTKNKYDKAFKSLCRFRPSRLQAARDVYYIHKSLVLEDKMREGKNLFKDFFRIKRNRKAAQSSFSVMFMQQVCRDLLRAEYGELTSLKFCGVNVIAYYSTQIFIDAEFSRSTALVVSLGTGIVNWLFAIPAFYTIDTFGRRNLLLTTFPLMGLFLLFTGFSFFIPDLDARPACVATGMYLFMVVYSPGEGPVPFTYSAEAFPLYIREYGMAFATATTWFFNFILTFIWPALVAAFTPQGAFGWYAGWNFIGWILCYFFLPETKGLSLEELYHVFSVSNREHAGYYLKSLPYYGRKLAGMDVERRRPLYATD